jgi:hypothetical protein
MNTSEENNHDGTPAEDGADKKGDAAPEPEFKVTVRKLQLPARPRGVLAE